MDRFVIDASYLTSCTRAWSKVDEEGNTLLGALSSVDHPAFTELREYLGAKGYINIRREWLNGDVVLKPFMLNSLVFGVGDQFSTAGALGVSLKVKAERTKPLLDEELFNV